MGLQLIRTMRIRHAAWMSRCRFRDRLIDLMKVLVQVLLNGQGSFFGDEYPPKVIYFKG